MKVRFCRRCFGIAQHVSLLFVNKCGNRFQSETPNARFAARTVKMSQSLAVYVLSLRISSSIDQPAPKGTTMGYKTDIEIARGEQKPIQEIGAKLDIPTEHLLPYGHDKTK